MVRNEILRQVTKILHGPIDGPCEKLEKNPLDFYSTGILFPQSETLDVEDQTDSEAATEFSTKTQDFDTHSNSGRRQSMEADEQESNVGLEFTTKFRPSAAGISVLVETSTELQITIRFATYEKKIKENVVLEKGNSKSQKRHYFERQPHEFAFRFVNNNLDASGLDFRASENSVWIDLLKDVQLNITTRPYQIKNNLVIRTITLINKNSAVGFSEQKRAEYCIFQPEINIHTPFYFYPFEDNSDMSLLTDEDLGLKLLYRNYKSYAQGHGISVNWNTENKYIKEVYTQVLPTEYVNGVDLNPPIFKDSDVLFMKRLSGKSLNDTFNWDDLHNELLQFVGLYKGWIDNEFEIVDENISNVNLRDKAKSNLQQCLKLYSRMCNGIHILNQNIDARKAFEDANRAMFMQRVMADFGSHRRNADRVQHNNDKYDDQLPDYKKIPFNAPSGKIWSQGRLSIESNNYDPSGSLARWRPFQLAFLLSQINGIVDPQSEDRDTVDLIWFPTGGGKTEAYLGLTAFTIFYRRLRAKKVHQDPDKGAGVSVLMRYTLRLLNKQQFERATILICACDLIRRSDTESYGLVRISNGIWMGSSMTPNYEKIQVNDYSAYIRSINNGKIPSTAESSPPILSCPCCGNRLIREFRNKAPYGRWGYFQLQDSRNRATGRFLIGCTNTRCDFHATAKNYATNQNYTLPVFEVDETIYLERPSLLFSTVDKFVQLAWNSRAFNLFNFEYTDNVLTRKYPSPDLIIQDELHLISSALGTIYGVYEIAIDKLCTESGGSIAKVVGATATVRNASEQCKRLYGRKHFLQFPPPATDADNSFYSVKIKNLDAKSRLYVGFMPSGVTTSTAIIRLSAVLLDRLPTLKYSNEELDYYYTLVVYFNSLKELGRYRTFLTDDIVAYRMLLAKFFQTFQKPFNHSSLCELSSVMTADEITSGLDRLEKTTLTKGMDSASPLLKNLFDAGIRTYSDLLTAKGATVWSRFINLNYFTSLGLNFTGDSKTDYQSFLNEVRRLNFSSQEPIQIAPATNMISVGVDIPRINTMIINGQPKTTAEYIQASSRVGRVVPGIVFTYLTPTKNRDRSHYEQFKTFHQSYYYFVESSSVTPFSQPALEKVLPTVLISLTRSLYLGGVGGTFQPSNPKYLQFIDQVFSDISSRVLAIHGAQANQIQLSLDAIKNSFIEMISRHQNRKLADFMDFMEYDNTLGKFVTKLKNPNSLYNAPAQFVDDLLKDHIPTMQTLRNVESSSKVRIK